MAYLKPQSPIKNADDYIYPLTTYDQVILKDGSRFTGESVANNLTTSAEGYTLDARQGRELNLLIQEKATTTRYTAKLMSSGWSSTAPYTQTVSVTGMLSTDNPIVDLDMSNVSTSAYAESLMEAWSLVGRITANNGSITAYCYGDVPSISVSLILKVVR